MLDAAHRKTAESSLGPKREDILESILFKSSDFVMVHFKDMDTNYARRGILFLKVLNIVYTKVCFVFFFNVFLILICHGVKVHVCIFSG